MYKRKGIFIVFEGIEGSGKTFHIKKLVNKIKKENLPLSITREPGGVISSEQIRKLILSGKTNKFENITDTLLYLAARNENLNKKIIPDLVNKKIVICDRFVDSTIAYQSYGQNVDIKFIKRINSYISNKIKPDFTFLLTLNINKSISRILKKKKKNRYDKFSKNFYRKVQRGYIDISKKNKNKYLVLDTSNNVKLVEKLIYQRFKKLIK